MGHHRGATISETAVRLGCDRHPSVQKPGGLPCPTPSSHPVHFWLRWPRSTPRSPRCSSRSSAASASTLEMIASENFVPRAVLESQGSVLTNKYAEGYPGRRYYGGCEFVDIAEQLAIDRAKCLFGAAYANVQPHSGASANAAVLAAIAHARRHDPGPRAGPRRPPHPRHEAQLLRQALQGARLRRRPERPFRVDMDVVRDKALEVKPQVIIAGWSAYPRQLDFAAFRAIADEVGALLWVDMAHFAGLVAAGLHPSPGAARARHVIHRAQDHRRPALGLHPDQRPRAAPRRSTPTCSRASRAARSCT